MSDDEKNEGPTGDPFEGIPDWALAAGQAAAMYWMWLAFAGGPGAVRAMKDLANLARREIRRAYDKRHDAEQERDKLRAALVAAQAETRRANARAENARRDLERGAWARRDPYAGWSFTRMGGWTSGDELIRALYGADADDVLSFRRQFLNQPTAPQSADETYRWKVTGRIYGKTDGHGMPRTGSLLDLRHGARVLAGVSFPAGSVPGHSWGVLNPDGPTSDRLAVCATCSPGPVAGGSVWVSAATCFELNGSSGPSNSAQGAEQ